MKEWWPVILACLGGAAWVGTIQKEVSAITEDHKDNPRVPVTRCDEIREGCKKCIDLQFAAGTSQFTDIKLLIAANDQKSETRHSELMRILLEMNKQH